MSPSAAREIAVALLTGGSDRPYVFGLTMELISKGAVLDVIGSDDLELPGIPRQTRNEFLKSARRSTSGRQLDKEKWLGVSVYYAKLIRYAATARSQESFTSCGITSLSFRSNAAYALLQVAGEKRSSLRRTM